MTGQEDIPRWYVEQVTGFLGLTLRILNRGAHYEFKRENLMLEWWPTTGRTGINRVYTERRRIATREQLRKWLQRKVTKYQRGKGLANWSVK